MKMKPLYRLGQRLRRRAGLVGLRQCCLDGALDIRARGGVAGMGDAVEIG